MTDDKSGAKESAAPKKEPKTEASGGNNKSEGGNANAGGNKKSPSKNKSSKGKGRNSANGEGGNQKGGRKSKARDSSEKQYYITINIIIIVLFLKMVRIHMTWPYPLLIDVFIRRYSFIE